MRSNRIMSTCFALGIMYATTASAIAQSERNQAVEAITAEHTNIASSPSQISRDQAIEAFTAELADIQREFKVQMNAVPASDTTYAGIVQNIVEKAKALRDQWQDNQYVEVLGFSISIGFSPSLDIQFQFK